METHNNQFQPHVAVSSSPVTAASSATADDVAAEVAFRDLIQHLHSDSASDTRHNLHSTVTASSRFNELYCGSIWLVHSYLSFPDLLRLSRVSHYYRGVAAGDINPAGSVRVPGIEWDAVKQVRSNSQSSSTHAGLTLVSNTPSFMVMAERMLQPESQNSSADTVPPISKEPFLAMVPAPAYGVPYSSRKCIVTLLQFDSLLLSPVLARHVQELEVVGEIHRSDYALIALRLPFLRALSIEPWSGMNRQLTPFWQERTNQLRFPVSLRSLTIARPTRYSDARNANNPVCGCESIMITLPSNLQDLEIICQMPDQCDLSPLLRLPDLQRLSFFFRINSTNKHHATVLQQLTQLKYFNPLSCSLSDVLTALPKKCPVLEEVVLGSSTKESQLKALAQRAPSLKVLDLTLSSEIADHSILLSFPSLQTLQFSQELYQYSGGTNCQLTPIAKKCIQVHCTLEAHIRHEIEAVSQMQTLTNLNMKHLYAPLSSRSVTLNAVYFESNKLVCPRTKVDVFWDHTPKANNNSNKNNQSNTNTEQASPSSSSSNIQTYQEIDLSRGSVFALISRMPQLMSLTLSDGSALHLASLAFLAHLPQLESLSLTGAFFLPIESLYELRHVSSTLTELTVNKCFPVDSSFRDVYLLHDVLQPLQFSSPITQAVTINFPTYLKTPSSSANGGSSSASSAAPTASSASFNVGLSSNAATSSVSLSPSIPPRHSSWYEIQSSPSPSSPAVESVLAVLKRENALAKSEGMFDKVVDLHPRLNTRVFSARAWQPPKEQQPYRVIFDSFTAHASPNAAGSEIGTLPLTSLLLPHLRSCKIVHEEPNMANATFTYDRSRCPSYQLGAPSKHEALENLLLEEERKQMHEMYGFENSVKVVDLPGMSYLTFLGNFEPRCRVWFVI